MKGVTAERLGEHPLDEGLAGMRTPARVRAMERAAVGLRLQAPLVALLIICAYIVLLGAEALPVPNPPSSIPPTR
jgi:hypothetical protein